MSVLWKGPGEELLLYKGVRSCTSLVSNTHMPRDELDPIFENCLQDSQLKLSVRLTEKAHDKVSQLKHSH